MALLLCIFERRGTDIHVHCRGGVSLDVMLRFLKPPPVVLLSLEKTSSVSVMS